MKIFEIFARNNISIDLVSVSEVCVSVTLDNDENLPKALEELAKFTTITRTDHSGMVSLVGENIINTPHIMKDISTLFYQENILVKMISYGATNINISFIVSTEDIEKVVRLLHRDHIENIPKNGFIQEEKYRTQSIGGFLWILR